MSDQKVPATHWKEVHHPDEETQFAVFAREIQERQRRFAERPGEPLRGFHAKSHAGLHAEFRILPDLPPHARHGVFREPKVFPAIVRFSNGEHIRSPDGKSQPRGIAIKLVGVAGPKLLTGPDGIHTVTQDFLATSHSVTSAVRDVRQFMAVIRAAESGRLDFLQLAREVGFAEAARLVAAIILRVKLSKVRSLTAEHYSSTAPIKFGPYAVKFTVRPATRIEVPNGGGQREHHLRDELAERLRRADLVMDFVVQFFTDERRTPIEDTSVAWKPAHARFLKVAELRIPRCDLNDPTTMTVHEAVDRLSFTPWHSIEDHRPLGNIMRARKVAYQMSASFRGFDPEPTSLAAPI